MRKNRTSGSVRGALGNRRSYREICQEAWYLHWRIKMFGKGQKLRKAANVIGLRKQLNVCGLRARLCNKKIVKNVR